jgi:hypothetical protein
MDGYHPRTKKRIEQLLADNAGLRREIEPLKARAETTQQLQKFLKDADIAKEEFGLVLDLSAALKRGDHKTFLEGIAPYVKIAQEALGITLPPDLAQAVRQGHMTQDAARYVAQERTARQLAEARFNRANQDITTRNETEARQSFQTAVAQTVANWENEVRRSDPDYARKEPLIRDLLHAVVQERGPPRSPQEAVEIARLAYERANGTVSRFNPTARPTRQVPSSISRVNGARPEPKSLREAVHLALERGR